jgi:phosphatidylglycerophosphate synthase
LNALPVSKNVVVLETQEPMAEYVHRPPGRWIAKRLVHTPVTPNQVTVLAGLAGMLAGSLLALGAERPLLRVAGGFVLMLACFLDCTDGELARARGTSSLLGMIIDGLTDNVVGTSVFLGMAYDVVVYTAQPWFWPLGIAAGLSAAAHVWIYDAKKKQYLKCLGFAAADDVQPVSALVAQRGQAFQEGRYAEAFLLQTYIFFRSAQSVGLATASAADPAKFYRMNRGRMRGWTLMGSSMHFFALYVAAIVSPLWPPSMLACVLFYVVPLNLIFAYLLLHDWV